MDPGYPATLLCCSLVILGGAFSTHLKKVKRWVKAGAIRERVQYDLE
jgi:hypothetical protein